MSLRSILFSTLTSSNSKADPGRYFLLCKALLTQQDIFSKPECTFCIFVSVSLLNWQAQNLSLLHLEQPHYGRKIMYQYQGIKC